MPTRNIFSFKGDRRGVALIEFAFVAPFLILLVLGAIELTRYILIIQKVEKSAYALSDIVAQYQPATVNVAQPAGEINESELATVFAQYSKIMSPYDSPGDQAIIVSSVTKRSGNVTINWQAAGGGTCGNCDGSDLVSIVNGISPSAIGPGVRGGPATFNSEINTQLVTMMDGENMIVGEMFFHYTPLLEDALKQLGFTIGPKTLVRRMYFHPRNCPGDGLPDLPPLFPVTTPPSCSTPSASSSSSSTSSSSSSGGSTSSGSSSGSTSSTSSSSSSTSAGGTSTSSSSSSSTSAGGVGTSSSTSAGGSGGSGGGCFTGDAEITMADGSTKPISELAVGDVVRGKTGNNHIVKIYVHTSDEALYGFNGSSPFVTAEHPIFTAGGLKSIDPALTDKETHHRMRTRPLNVGDVLQLDNGGTRKLQLIESRRDGTVNTLYNPVLDGDHTYYSNGILVHNPTQKH